MTSKQAIASSLIAAAWSAAFAAPRVEVLWEREVPAHLAGVKGAAIEAGRLFIANEPESARGLQARAFDARTGEELWSHVVQETPGYVTNLAAKGGRLFAVGLGVTRAYDARTGDVLWESRMDGLAKHVVVHADRVLVSGPSFLRAFDGDTGSTLWEGEGAGGSFYGGLTAADGGVFVCGDPGEDRFFIRAHDADTGHLRWEAHAEGTAVCWSVSAQGGRLYAAGYVYRSYSSDPLPLVRAYDPRTGTVIWENVGDDPTVAGVHAPMWTVVAQGRVLVSGAHGVRAYDAHAGELLWDLDAVGCANGIVVESGALIVVEGVSLPGSDEAVVRVLDVRTGEPIWQDVITGLQGSCSDNKMSKVLAEGGIAIVVVKRGPHFMRAYRVR